MIVTENIGTMIIMSNEQAFKAFIKDDNEDYKYVDYDPIHCIAGDTDSVYLDLSSLFDEGADSKDVIEVADHIGTTVNDKFSEYMKSVFNVSEERSKPIETERENVSDKSVFFGKKRYAMHVIDSEGVTCDKPKIMGLEIKRSDTPKVIQDMLTRLVNMMMDNEPYEVVRGFLDTFKTDFYTLNALQIGRPMGVKKVHEYTEKYLNFNSWEDIPYHVKATMLFNMARDDKFGDQIVSGNKIKFVYILDPEMKAIALPETMNENDEFVLDLVVDYDTIWNTVQKKIDSYLIPIGYDRQNRQQDKVNGLFEF